MSSVPFPADTRRLDRSAWLTLAFVLGFALFCAIVSALVMRLPSDGCVMSDYVTGATTPQIVDVCYGDWPTPLRHGDKVVAFGSFTISNEIDGAIPTWGGTAPPPGWGVGATIPYTVQRGDATLQLAVPIGQLSWGAVGRVFLYVLGPSNNKFGGWIQELVLQLSAVIIFALAPRSIGARLLLLAFGTQFAFTRLGWGGEVVSSAAAFAQGPLSAANHLANGFWIWGFWPSLILLVLSFPRRVWPITRWPRLFPAALYVVPLLVVLASPFIGVPLFYIIVLLGQFVLLFGAFIAVTTHTFMRVPDRVVRAQTGWLLLALGSYLIPVMLLYPFILFDPFVKNTWLAIILGFFDLLSLLLPRRSSSASPSRATGCSTST